MKQAPWYAVSKRACVLRSRHVRGVPPRRPPRRPHRDPWGDDDDDAYKPFRFDWRDFFRDLFVAVFFTAVVSSAVLIARDMNMPAWVSHGRETLATWIAYRPLP